MDRTVAEILVDHFISMKVDKMPVVRLQQAKVLLCDYLGVALGGSQTDSGKIASNFAKVTGGEPKATIIGDGTKVPAVHAAFANAIASHSIELDDVDVLALFHFSPPVVSAALAVAEQEGSTGKELLTAIALGCEMMARASHATNFSLRNRGFHTTPTCGVFGAAVASAYLMHLDRDQFISALGLAGAQSSGLMEMYGPSMQKRFNPGPAARNGVTSATIASLGFTGTATIFEGERGFCRCFTDEYDIDAFTRNLGDDFPDEFEFKPYSCARPIHNVIDCAINIRKELVEPISAVKSITVRRHPQWAEYHQNAAPKTYHEAQVSLPYSVAVALLEGAALFPQYSNDKLGDPEILRLSAMVKIVSDDTLPRGVSCLMEVETVNGQKLASQVDHPSGSIKNPMTAEQMSHKVHLLADPVLGAEGTDALISIVNNLDHADTIVALLNHVIPTRTH